MSTLTMDKVSKRYGNGVEAVHKLDLQVGEGEFLVMVGPSGCGKTTALRMVAGLEQITSGELRIGDQVANHLPPKARDIAMVFQNYALYPQMTVAENIGFALRMRKMSKVDVAKKVREAAEILDLTEQLDRKPGQLSGGQRQRVAMGRSIVRDPKVFLMDEPLSNLDAKLRVQMRAEVSKLQRHLGVATLYVTHDQIEAMTMGDRVAVLQGGRLQQCAPPQELYDRPANLFVAAFMGSPSMNLYQATLTDDATRVKLGSQYLEVPATVHAARPGLAAYRGQPIVVGIRPEDLVEPASDAGDVGSRLVGDVELVEALGPELIVYFRLDATGISGDLTAGAGAAVDDELDSLTIGTIGANERTAPAGSAVGAARVPPASPAKIGQRVTFCVAPAQVKYFDPASGAAIRSDGVGIAEGPAPIGAGPRRHEDPLTQQR